MKRLLFISLFILLTPLILYSNNPVGKIIDLSGRVDVFKAGRNFAVKARLGQNVYVGDIYRVKSKSYAVIKFINNNVLKIAPRSKVKIEEFLLNTHSTKTEVKLSRGKVEAFAPKKFIRKIGTYIEKNVFEVKTPTAVAGVKGTNFIVFYLNNITGVLFLEGKGYVYNPKLPQNIRLIKAGEISFLVDPKQPPTKPRKATSAEMKSIATTPTQETTTTQAAPTTQIEAIAEMTQTTEAETNTQTEVNVATSEKEPKPKVKNDVNDDISSMPATSTVVNKLATEYTTSKTDNIPPKFYDYENIKYNYIPQDVVEIFVSDENLDYLEVNNKIFKSEEKPLEEENNLYIFDLSLNDLNLHSGLNLIDIKAYDKEKNVSNLKLPIFIGNQNLYLTGNLYLNNIKETLINGILSISPETTDAASLFYSYSKNTLNGDLFGGGTVGNNEGFWKFSSDKGFFSIIDNYIVESDFTNSNDFLNKIFYDSNSKEILSTNYLKLISCKTADYTVENLEKTYLSNLKIAFLNDNTIKGLGILNNPMPDYYKSEENFSLKITSDNLNILGNFNMFVFNNKIYGTFIGYIKDLDNLNESIISLTGNVNDVNIISFNSDTYNFNSLGDQDINSIKFFERGGTTFNSTDYDITYSPVFSNLIDDNKGLTYGEITGKVNSPDFNIDNFEHLGGRYADLSFTDTLMWFDLSDIDKTDVNYLKKLENGILVSPYYISYVDGYLLGDYNENTFTSNFFGKWYDLKYFSFIYFDSNYYGDTTTDFWFDWRLVSEYSLLSTQNGSPFHILGLFSDEIKEPFVFSTNFESINYSNYSSTTYEGDSYFSYIGGYIDENLNVKGFISGIFVNQDGYSGLLFSDVNGIADNNIKMANLEGTFIPIYKSETPLISPDSLYESVYPMYTDSQSEYLGISGENWGIFSSYFENYQINSSTEENLLTYISHGTVNINSDLSTIDQTVYGFGANVFIDENKKPITWISVGKALGIKDVTENSFKLIITGAWFETKNFLEMVQVASTNPELLEKLQKVNIPCVEVGKVDLTGNNGNIDVTMKDVTFFSVYANEKPKVWATGNVYGSYMQQPQINESVNLTGGSNFSATFTVKDWSDNRWMAEITKGYGTLNDKYKGDVSFKGIAAGTYLENVPTTNQSINGDIPPGKTTTGQFLGTAAGTVQ